jgi:hypothetical protein
MRDYIRMLAQCKQAIAARDGALSAWNAASAALLTKRDRLERAKEDKAAALRAEVTLTLTLS